jgi:hypothetical protein
MGTSTEHAKTAPDLAVTRTPVGPDVAKPKTDGDFAVMDAVLIVAVAWAILFALMFSLRSYNI